MVSNRTKNPNGEQLFGPLEGELAIFYEVGLYQRGIGDRSRYRYKASLLRYQQYLGGKPPTLEATTDFLVHLKKSGFAPATIKVYRSVMSLFHAWRGEILDFTVKIPRRKPPYIQ